MQHSTWQRYLPQALRVSLLGFVLAAVVLPLAAEAAPGSMQACRRDMQVFCGSVPRGAGAKNKCLLEKLDQLTPDCRAVMLETPAGKRLSTGGGTAPAGSTPSTGAGGAPAAKGFGAACRTDIATHCKGQKGQFQCLSANKEKLSAECREAVELRDQARRIRSTACAADAATLCKKGPGAPRMMDCLRANQDKLSPECAKAVNVGQIAPGGPDPASGQGGQAGRGGWKGGRIPRGDGAPSSAMPPQSPPAAPSGPADTGSGPLSGPTTAPPPYSPGMKQ